MEQELTAKLCGGGVSVRAGERKFTSGRPAELLVWETEGAPVRYACGYEETGVTKNGFWGTARVRSARGSLFCVEDRWQNGPDGEVRLKREVSVLACDGHDAGFASLFSIGEEETRPIEDYEVYIPGIWYGKNTHTVAHAFGSGMRENCCLIRATRMARPYAELYRDGIFLALAHEAPAPGCGQKETSARWLADDALQYPSLGVEARPAARLCYCFPGSEGEKNYIEPNRGWAWRCHPVRTGVRHSYSLTLFGGGAENSREALREVWRHFYRTAPPAVRRADYETVYRDGAELLDTYCQEYNKAVGLPFWTAVPEGSVCDISYQMGFVGQQTMCAYHLIRYGRENGREETAEKGRRLIDFWVRHSADRTALPRVWYNVFPASFREGYPCYTRTLADGMEGILCAARLCERLGEEKKEWKEFCLRWADWLALHQNADGSYFRAYEPDGRPAHEGKFNTSNVIRFLVNMYWWTGEERYQSAALRAGEFCFREIYAPMQYVGGTADNDNTVDKEAGMLALYAFAALYEMDGAPKWLEAACGAADFCETWTYVWEFPVRPYKGSCVFEKTGISGLSLIATGHSHADVMMAYMPYEYYRLYLWTGDTHYLEFARFLNGSARQTTDWSRKLGYVYPGLVEESGELALQYHNGLGRWLPWCTIAEIEALTRLKERFGSMDIEEIEEERRRTGRDKNGFNGCSWMRV